MPTPIVSRGVLAVWAYALQAEGRVLEFRQWQF